MRIDVIVNTTARRYQATPTLLEAMANACEGAAALHPTSSLTALDVACTEIAQRGTDLVVISGGDGSFMAGVTALARAFATNALPALVLLPGGTVATVARNWGMRGDPVSLLRCVIHRCRARGSAAGAGVIRRPTLRVRATTHAGHEERIGFIFGTGLVARFFDLYYAHGAGGYPAAARIVARVFFDSFYGGAYAKRVLTPLPCSIQVEGRRLAPTAWSLVCCSVVPDLGIHMRVNYRAGEDLVRPHLVASALSPRQLGPRAPLVLAGKRIGGRNHFDDLVRDFTVCFEDRVGSAPSADGPYILDGDPLWAREVNVSAGPPIDVLSPGVG